MGAAAVFEAWLADGERMSVHPPDVELVFSRRL